MQLFFFIQVFLHKLACHVSCVLDVDDCPLHSVVHDIVLFPKYRDYDLIYHPQFYLEIFEIPMTVKE
jgi:hypothetical protein